jgi:molybdate-binding protein
VLVELLTELASVERTAVVLGCDPALATLGAHLARRHAGTRLLTTLTGSLAALEALAGGEAHIAGMHLLDEASGEYNLPYVRRAFAGRRVSVVTAAHWAQGLIVARGNPLGIAGAADLARPDVAIVNREPGSGSRAALDHALRAAGIEPATVRGYGRAVGSHRTVAEVVAAGLADAGPGIEAAAAALGLGFVRLAHERYDLVIPAEARESPPVQALLETLASPAFRAELGALPGYDASRTGTVVLDERAPAGPV